METTQVSKDSEVKEYKGVTNGEVVAKQPQEAVPTQPLPLVGTLETAVKDTLDEMRHCDEQAGLWMERKRQLQGKMNEALERIQKQFGVTVDAKTPPKTRVDKNATVPDLIRKFLEANGPARTKDIRKFLLAHGKKTNPGVALGRMVKNGDLKHAERGVYKIASK